MKTWMISLKEGEIRAEIYYSLTLLLIKLKWHKLETLFYTRRGCWQQHLCVENKSSLIRNVCDGWLWDWETQDYYDSHHLEIHIQSLASLTGGLIQRSFSTRGPPGSVRVEVSNRCLLSEWLTAYLSGVEKFLHHIFFTHFPLSLKSRDSFPLSIVYLKTQL